MKPRVSATWETTLDDQAPGFSEEWVVNFKTMAMTTQVFGHGEAVGEPLSHQCRRVNDGEQWEYQLTGASVDVVRAHLRNTITTGTDRPNIPERFASRMRDSQRQAAEAALTELEQGARWHSFGPIVSRTAEAAYRRFWNSAER